MAYVPEDKHVAIGVDLGTTFSCVAILQNGRPVVIPNGLGNRLIPSCVSFTPTECLVGDEAVERLTTDPANTVYECKRVIGRTYRDSELEQNTQNWPFKIIDDHGKPKIHVDYQGEPRHVYPEAISGQVLRKVKHIAEAHIKQEVTKAVITVPAYFNNSQRQATINSARIAGLDVLRILNEPTAAALAHGLDKKSNDTLSTVVVVDLGGGTFDVSVLEIEDGAIRVLATGGDSHLGGTDFDQSIFQDAVAKFNKDNDLNVTLLNGESRKKEISQLRKACEAAKRSLSENSTAHIRVNNFYHELDLTHTLTRREFENLNKDLFSDVISRVRSVLHDAKTRPDEVDEVLLVGGSTRIPKIQELLKELFDERILNSTVNPEEIVACGAAIQAAILGGSSSPELEDMGLLDVTPLTLGLNSEGRFLVPVIKRNSLVPCRQTRRATTSYENQTSMDLVVYQGERPVSEANHFIGVITIDNIPPGKPEDTIVDVTFELDENGCLTVTADSRGILDIQKTKFDPNRAHVSDTEVQRLLEEAKAHELKDQQLRKRVEARNELVLYHQKVKAVMESDNLVISPVKKWAIVSKVKDTDIFLDQKHQATENDYRKVLKELKVSCTALPVNCDNSGAAEIRIENSS